MSTVAESILTLTSGDYPSQPFSPILPWCRLQLEGTEKKTLLSRLNKLGVRSPFREITASYLNGETPPEREDPLPMEKYYEREMFSHTLIRLFFSLIGKETGEVRIILEGDRSRLQDSLFNRLEKAPPPRGRELNLKVRREGEIIHWDGLSSLTLPPGGLGEESDPELLIRALWFTLFGDNITACPYLGHLYEKARVGSLELNTEERAVLFREYGRVSLNLNLDDQALTSFNSLLNLGLVWRRKDFSAWAYRLTGEVYRKRGRPNEAALFFRKGLAQKTDQPGIRLSCLYGLFSLEEKSHPLSRSEKRELIALAEKERHFKYLALLLLEEENPSFPRIFALIDRTKNPLLKSKACLRRALYEEESGSPPEETAKWLRRALQNSRRGHYPPLESRIHLIMGKFYGKHNDPVKGFSCFRKSIEGNLKGEDFREIALAYGELGRMSLNLFETARAGYFLDTALQLLNVLPSREEDPIGEFGLLKELTLLAKGDREYGEVLTVFKRKKRRSSGEKELFLLLMESRLAEKREKKEKLLARATDQARREGSFLLPWLEEAEGGEFSVPRQKWLKDPLDRDLIALSLKQFIRFNRLKKSMYEINLLWSVQTILAKAPDREMLILRTMERLLSSSLLSSISYYERLEESYRLAYHSSLIEEEPNRAILDRFIARCGEGRTDLITEKEGWFCLPIYLENIPAGLIICQTESLTVPMKTEERQVYTILALSLIHI